VAQITSQPRRRKRRVAAGDAGGTTRSNVPVDPQGVRARLPRPLRRWFSRRNRSGRSARNRRGAKCRLARLGLGGCPAWRQVVAITDVWLGETGWIGTRLHSNLYQVMEYPLDVTAARVHQRPAKSATLGTDEKTLRRYLGGEQLSSDDGTTYLATAARCERRTIPCLATRSSLGSITPTRRRRTWCIRRPSLSDPRKRYGQGRGEKWEHYQDWTSNPEKYQLFELTVLAPAPSNVPPAGFKEWDLEWWAHIGVDNQAFADLVMAMRNAGQDAEVYDRFADCRNRGF